MKCSGCGVEIPAEVAARAAAAAAAGFPVKCMDCWMGRPHNIQTCPRCKKRKVLVRLYLLQGVACDPCKADEREGRKPNLDLSADQVAALAPVIERMRAHAYDCLPCAGNGGRGCDVGIGLNREWRETISRLGLPWTFDLLGAVARSGM